MNPSASRPVLVALALLGVAGCGTHAATSTDAGDGSVEPETAPQGRRSFDVVATFAGPVKGLPPTNTFTLVLDPDARQVIVGGMGRAVVVPAASADGRTFTVAAPFSVGVLGSACDGLTMIDYTSLTLTLAGSSFHGKAMGAGQISCGDCQFMEPFVADVTGVPDATPPLLFTSGAPTNPFQAFSVVTSEPLPATATAHLTGGDGSHVELVPIVVDGVVPLVTGFLKPDVVLAYGQGYVVTFDGLVDFAGLRGSADGPLRLASFDAPPLVAEDGFEGATGTSVGGAPLVTAAPLAPLDGAKSVYIGPAGAPAPAGITPGASLHVRLAISPGDTMLKFSYRTLSRTQGGFFGVVLLGSVGHKADGVASLDPPTNTPPATQTQWPDGTTTFASDILSGAIPLPPDVGDELLVSFETSQSFCGLPEPPAGVLIDDLRLE